MKNRIVFPLTFLAAAIALVGCFPTQAQLASLKTQIIGEVFETLTAVAPTATGTPDSTATPTPTLEPSITPTPFPSAQVLAGNLNLREGPGTLYPSITLLMINTELKILGQFANCSWWKVRTADGVEGWVKGGSGFIRYAGECANVPHGSFRPPTGSFIFDRRTTVGPGTLTVQNGGRQDAVVVMADQVGSPFIAFYIREGENFTLDRVPDGSYLIFFMLGSEWDGDDQIFMFPQSYRRLDDLLVFTTTAGSATNWSISLQATAGGVGKSSEISEREFPKLK
ncbi:MAG: SH3 domain-containing protein [Anaerolineae bacterium]|nr:SH3 domain-containing protein [Anaerolineae bacterium]